MRTTLEIDDDVILAAKELASRQGKTAGKVLSELARRGIRAPPAEVKRARVVNGFEVLPAGGRVITAELVQRILEETEDA
ncbi:MAG TPA: antitoxin [Thermoanaerobaculia bacterium]|nr:antitoxin [Thermoanaerobaculia bacterium]